MKNRIFSFIAILAMTLGLASCNDDNWNPDANKGAQGTVSLSSLGVDINDSEQTVASSRASVDLSGFIVEIAKGGQLVQKWTYAMMPEVFSLPEGDYSVSVYSHDMQDAEWDRPYYQGQKTFTIVKNEITEIGTVTCTFQSVRVSVTFTDELAAAMGNDCKVVVEVGQSGTSLEFDKAHYSSSAYFRPVEGSMTLIATFKGTVQGNYTETKPLSFTDVAAGKHYRLNFSAKGPDTFIPEETGAIDLGSGIILDTDILGSQDVNGNVGQDEDPLDPNNRPGKEDPKEDNPDNGDPDDSNKENPDDPDNGDKPQPGGDPITIACETLSFDAVNTLQKGAASYPEGIVKLHADNKMAHLYVKIESSNANFASAVSEFLPMEFDLAYPGSYADAFKGSLNFPVGNEIIGQTDQDFNITMFIPLLAGFDGDHSFTITIEDQANPANSFSKTLKFTVK